MFRILILTFCFWLTASFAHARQSLALDTGNTEITLISSHDTIMPGETFTIALRMKFDGNWYTYWRNAGDSGEAVNIAWDLPAGVTAGPIMWPAPEVKTVGPITSYALSGDVWLPIEISVDGSVDPNQPLTLKAHAYYLVCDDICIPEDGALSLPMGVGTSQTNPVHMTLIESTKAKIPQASGARGSVTLEAGQIVFDIADLPSGFTSPKLFPHANPIMSHSEPIALTMAEKGVRFSALPGYGWDEGLPQDFSATLVAEDGRAIVVPIATNSRIDIGKIGTGGANAANIGIWGAIIGAFIGGLILNLMPCVFPIISLKALSLAKTAHGERAAIRRSAWAYTFGVLVLSLIHI